MFFRSRFYKAYFWAARFWGRTGPVVPTTVSAQMEAKDYLQATMIEKQTHPGVGWVVEDYLQATMTIVDS